MSIFTDSIVAGPPGHTRATEAGRFWAPGAGDVRPGLPGAVPVDPATEPYAVHEATMPFSSLNATQAAFSPNATGSVIHVIS